MENQEFKERMDVIQQEIREALLNGKFTIVSVFATNFNQDVYNLTIFGNYSVRLLISSYHEVIVEDLFIGVNLNDKEQKTIYDYIQAGGLKMMIESKKSRIECLNKEVDNLKRILEGKL